jgi:hypothetical protein
VALDEQGVFTKQPDPSSPLSQDRQRVNLQLKLLRGVPMNQSDTPGSNAGDLVSLGDEKKVIEVVSASILSLWEAVNILTR